jgi:hypothetical protein
LIKSPTFYTIRAHTKHCHNFEANKERKHKIIGNSHERLVVREGERTTGWNLRLGLNADVRNSDFVEALGFWWGKKRGARRRWWQRPGAVRGGNEGATALSGGSLMPEW